MNSSATALPPARRTTSARFSLAIRAGLVLLGLLMPLNLPFALPNSPGVQALGWSGTPLAGGGMLVTRTLGFASAAGLLPGDVVRTMDGEPATPESVERVRRAVSAGDSLSLLVSRRGGPVRVVVPVAPVSAGYTGYLWYRFLLALAGWLIGMALLVRRGSGSFPLLGAALLFLAPVTLPVEIPGRGPVLTAINTVWQLQGGAYRFFFPALLLHFLVLQTGKPRALRPRRVWVALYLGAFAALLGISGGLREPLAWRSPGFEQDVRATVGLLYELIAVAGILVILRGLSSVPRPLRWLVVTTFAFVASGVPIAVALLLPSAPPEAVAALRQVKSLALLLLIAIVGLYLLVLGQSEAEEWRTQRRLASSASVVLTGLYGFAVAGAAAIVRSLELRLGEVEGLLFISIFLTAILFSPVLRWAREMVDRQMFARWAELEVRAHGFVDRVSAELEPERIAESVSRELPPLLDVAWARLVVSRELIDAWGLSEPPRLPTLPAAVLAEQSSARPDDGELSVPVYRPHGEILGALRLGPRHDGRAFGPPERAVLRTFAQGVAAALRNAEAYVKLLRAQQELDEAERIASLGALASGLAHEIKNPLAGLRMGLYLLEKEGGNGERMRRIRSDVRRIDDLVSGLLRFTLAGVVEPQEPVDLPRLAAECVEDVRSLARDRGAVLVERYPREKATALGGRSQLRLVISNLLMNALQAVGDGGTVEVEVRTRPDTLVLEVRDSGPGIPEEQKPRIFDLSFSTKTGGSGLGLALARREAERLGGSIELAAEEARGTRLRVVLPRLSLR